MGNIAKPFIKGTATLGTWFGIPKTSVGNLGKNIFGVSNQWGASANIKEDAAKAAQAAALAPPSANVDGYSERDRIRRLAKKAQGQQSTIVTGGTGAAYTGAPKQLLGT